MKNRKKCKDLWSDHTNKPKSKSKKSKRKEMKEKIRQGDYYNLDSDDEDRWAS